MICHSLTSLLESKQASNYNLTSKPRHHGCDTTRWRTQYNAHKQLYAKHKMISYSEQTKKSDPMKYNTKQSETKLNSFNMLCKMWIDGLT